MGDIISFNENTRADKKQEEDSGNYISLPSLEEIEALKDKAAGYDTDEMIDICHWDGACWKTFFEKVAAAHAEEIGADAWDVFAVLMAKMNAMSCMI